MTDEIETILAQPTMTVAEFARVARVGTNAAYDVVKNRQIESGRVGRQIRIPTAAVKRMLGLTGEAAPQSATA